MLSFMKRFRAIAALPLVTIAEISLGYREYKSGAVSLTSGLEWEEYVGERIEITVGYDDRNFPTDTTMPLGMMRANPSDVKVLS